MNLQNTFEQMLRENCLPGTSYWVGPKKKQRKTKPVKPGLPACDICESVEDLYEQTETQAIVTLVPHLSLLRKHTASGQICKDCVRRLVRLTFRYYDKKTKRDVEVKYEDLQRQMHNQGQKISFESVITTAVRMGLRVHLKVRKAVFKRMMQRVSRRETSFRAGWDAQNRRYETFEKMAQQRKRDPPDKPTLSDFYKLYVATKTGKSIDTHPDRKPPKVLTLKTFARLLFKQPYDIMDYAIADSSRGVEYEKLIADPCRACSNIICSPDCEDNVLYRRTRTFYGLNNDYTNDYVATQRMQP